MSIAIVIPSLNSPIIYRVIATVAKQEGFERVDEVVVVGKDEARLLPTHPKVRLVDTGSPVSAGTARNIGIGATSAELLIFLDSDCLPQARWLREHLAAHAAGRAVVGGSVLPTGDGYWHRCYNLTLFHEFFADLPAGERDFFPTLNLSVERRVIESAGLLNEALIRGQDVEWTTRMRRAGFQPYFWPSAQVRHQHSRTSLAAVWRDCARSGYHMRQVRLRQADMLAAPFWLRYRPLPLLLSPAIAAGVTGRIVGRHWRIFGRSPHQIPAIYLTKIAWCWGASRRSEPA